MVVPKTYDMPHILRIGGIDFHYASGADFLRKGYDHSIYFGNNKERTIAVILAEAREEVKIKHFIVPLPPPGMVGERDLNAKELRALLKEAAKKEGLSMGRLEKEIRALRN